MLLFRLHSAAVSAGGKPTKGRQDYALLLIYQKITQSNGITMRFDRINASKCGILWHIRRDA